MKPTNLKTARMQRIYLNSGDCRIEDLAALTSEAVQLEDYPFASDVHKNVLIYDCNTICLQIADAESRIAIMAEWVDALHQGPGVVVLKHAETDDTILDQASAVFWAMIDEQHRTGSGGGDHFAKPGANDRVWNSLGKHCLKDPENFVAYYGNPILALISEAWLGPYYQVTAQLNVVNPGGAAQSAHRDYHLGFLVADDVARYPLHVHRFSPMLTLQGAIAHFDAPLETGPTLLLPFSQKYDAGYLAMNSPDFKEFFNVNSVQLPLEKGDMLFFSPALFHAAGTNRSRDVRRMVNLFQISSAFGRSMETVDRTAMCKALFPVLINSAGRFSTSQIECAIGACAEGYSFPTNLDRDPPLGGLAPKTQRMLFEEALAAGWSSDRFNRALDDQAARKLA